MSLWVDRDGFFSCNKNIDDWMDGYKDGRIYYRLDLPYGGQG